MPIKVAADGLTLVTTTSEGKAMATIPDICKVPCPPGGTVPVPFPNVAESKDVKGGSIMTKVHGGSVALAGSFCNQSTGDEAGVAGGVVSGCTKGKAIFMKWSPTVKIEGRPVCRKSDMMIMNTCNTVSLSGMNQEDIETPEDEEREEELVPFKMQFQENLSPAANKKFTVRAREKLIKGTTDGEGRIDIEIPKSCTSVKVRIDKNDPITVQIKESSPQGKKAIQQRLANLGFYTDIVHGRIDDKTETSTVLFQDTLNETDKEDLKLDGDPGPVTEGKLKEKTES